MCIRFVLLSLILCVGINCFATDTDAEKTKIALSAQKPSSLFLEKESSTSIIAVPYGIDPDDFKHRRGKRSRAITCEEDLNREDLNEELDENGKMQEQQKRSNAILKAAGHNAHLIAQYRPFA